MVVFRAVIHTLMANPVHPRLLPISRVLLIATGSLVALAGGSVLLLLRAAGEHVIFEMSSTAIVRSMDVVETVIRSQLDPAQRQVESLARLIATRDFDPQDRREVAATLQGAVAAVPQIRVLVYCDAALEAVSVTKNLDDQLTIAREDWSQEETIRSLDASLRDAEQSRWGELITSAEIDRKLLNVSAAVRREDEYVGFLAAAITTRTISRVLDRLEETMGVSTYLTLGREQMIAHPTLADEQSSAAPSGLFPHLTVLRNSSTTRLVRHPVDSTGATYRGDVEQFAFHWNGDKYAGFSRSLDDYGTPPLSIGAYCPAEHISAPMQLLYTAAASSLLLLGVALAVAALLSRTISRPIRRVSRGVTQIGQLDLSEVSEMPSSRIREVDDLSEAFNRMLTALRSFSTYVPLQLANLVVQGVVGAKVASVERELTVMFTDIAGFTALSEGMQASELADFINDHLTMLATCVVETGGTIDKYIGDSLMAFWGAPEPSENTADAACRAATLMASRLRDNNQLRLAAGQKPIRLRIGVHTGPLVVGNFGAPGRINYSVFGDTVNVAQRLEALGKQVDPNAEVVTLVSEATAQQLSGDFVTHPKGDFQLRGKQHVVGVRQLEI